MAVVVSSLCIIGVYARSDYNGVQTPSIDKLSKLYKLTRHSTYADDHDDDDGRRV